MRWLLIGSNHSSQTQQSKHLPPAAGLCKMQVHGEDSHCKRIYKKWIQIWYVMYSNYMCHRHCQRQEASYTWLYRHFRIFFISEKKKKLWLFFWPTKPFQYGIWSLRKKLLLREQRLFRISWPLLRRDAKYKWQSYFPWFILTRLNPSNVKNPYISCI